MAHRNQHENCRGLLLMDIQNIRLMYLKASMFILIGICCFILIWIENRTIMTALLLVIMTWAFCRAYYFAFYVIEKYIDRDYRFSGLISFFSYLRQTVRQNSR